MSRACSSARTEVLLSRTKTTGSRIDVDKHDVGAPIAFPRFSFDVSSPLGCYTRRAPGRKMGWEALDPRAVEAGKICSYAR